MHQENNATFIKLEGVSWVTADGEYGYGDVIVYDQLLKHVGDVADSQRYDYVLEAITNGELAAIQEWGDDIA